MNIRNWLTALAIVVVFGFWLAIIFDHRQYIGVPDWLHFSSEVNHLRIYKADSPDSPFQSYGTDTYNRKTQGGISADACDKAYCIILPDGFLQSSFKFFNKYYEGGKSSNISDEKQAIIQGVNRCGKEFAVNVRADIEYTFDYNNDIAGKIVPQFYQNPNFKEKLSLGCKGDNPDSCSVPTNIYKVSENDIMNLLYKDKQNQFNAWFDKFSTNPQTVKDIEEIVVQTIQRPYNKDYDKYIKLQEQGAGGGAVQVMIRGFDNRGDPSYSLNKYFAEPNQQNSNLAQAFSCVQR